jgi:hypothetical protein
MPEEHHRHRSQRRSSPFRLFFKTFWVEILIVVGLILTLFLLFEQMNIRTTLAGWFRAAIAAGLSAATQLFDDLVSLPTRFGLSELIAIPMLIGVVILLIWRIRWRLCNTPALADAHCPRCGGGLQRVHRYSLDRAISVFVPVRRYRCTNRDCGWSGMRVSTYGDRGRAKPVLQ